MDSCSFFLMVIGTTGGVSSLAGGGPILLGCLVGCLEEDLIEDCGFPIDCKLILSQRDEIIWKMNPKHYICYVRINYSMQLLDGHRLCLVSSFVELNFPLSQ